MARTVAGVAIDASFLSGRAPTSASSRLRHPLSTRQTLSAMHLLT